MRALISGSSGFLGQNLFKELKKHEIRSYPLLRETLQKSILIQQEINKIKPEYIFCCHAYGNMYHQIEEDLIITANYINTWNLLRASSNFNYKTLVYISTSSIFLPYETLYSATKAGAEKLCKAYSTKYDKSIIIVRPYSIYGPGEADFRFIPTVFRSCLTGEPMVLAEGTHDWITIQDFTTYLLKKIIVNKNNGYQEWNIGTGIPTKNSTIVNIIEKISGKKANIINKKQLRLFDNDQWYAPKPIKATKLEEGLQQCFTFYKNKYGN